MDKLKSINSILPAPGDTDTAPLFKGVVADLLKSADD